MASTEPGESKLFHEQGGEDPAFALEWGLGAAEEVTVEVLLAPASPSPTRN